MQGWESALEVGNDGPLRRTAILMGSGPFAAGWTSVPGSTGGARDQNWLLGAGFPLPGGLAVGGRAVRRTTQGDAWGWSGDLGTIWRPIPHLSLGWDWENPGGRDEGRWRGHGVAVGIRPFGDPSLALGLETWTGRSPVSSESWDEAVHELSGEVRPLPWLAATGRWIPRRDDAWSFGLSAQLNSYARLFARTSPGAEGGSLQGIGAHFTGLAMPGATNSVPPGSFVYHVGKFSGEAGEEGLFRSTKGFAQIRDDLLAIHGRSEVKVLVLDLGAGRLSLSQAGQLRRLVLKLREGGKTVVAWSQDLTMASLHVMSACDKAAISPLGTVRSRGLALRTIYAGSALRQRGIDVQVVRTGPWKSAMESYVADRMSDEARQDLQAHLHDLDSMILGGVALGRGIDPVELLGWIDTGSMLASKAVRAGILDTLLEPQEVLAWAAPGLRQAPMALARTGTERWGDPKQVAILALEGQIVDRKGAMGMVPWAHTLPADEVVRILDGLRTDPRVGAVVLRVNSPGGSVVGSERIRRAVAELDKVKPVVASFGGMAASGAYLFSLPARRLWSEPEALVGSIGVFTTKISIERLLDSLGLHVETVSTGPDAGTASVLVPLDSAQLDRVREQVEDAHRMFSQLVRSSRGLDSAAFSRLDGGRVFTGSRAAANGLADSLGGLEDAVEWVAKEAGLEVVLTQWVSPGSSRWTQLASRLEASASARPWSAYLDLLGDAGPSVWAQSPWEIDGP
jgi:protease-4